MARFEDVYKVLKPHQRYIVDKVTKHFDDYNYFVINAPTGTGKTLVGLAIVKWMTETGRGFKTVWFTRTHNEYHPIVRDINKFGIGLKAIPLIGKWRLCKSPLKRFVGSLVEFSDICKKCNLDKNHVEQRLCEIYTSTMDINEMLRHIPLDACPYYTTFNSLIYADVILATYPYLVGICRKRLEMYIDPELFIIDEGHNLEHLHMYLQIHLRLETLEYLKNQQFDVQSLIDVWTSKYTQNKRIIYVDKALVKGAVQQLDKRIFQICLDPEAFRGIFSDDIIQSVMEICIFIQYLDLPGFDVYVTKDGFRLFVSDPYQLIQCALDRKTIIMSGSLPSKDYVENVWGLKCLYIDIEKELNFRYGEREWYIASDVTTKLALRKQFIEKYRKYLDKLLSKTESIQLVVFPSYDFMSKFTDIAHKHMCLIESERGTSINEVIRRANDGEIKCIFAVAGGRLTEGVEITKDGRSLIKTIIIVGVPYPEPSDWLDRKAKALSKRIPLTTTLRYKLLFHEPAKILVKQAIGRGIRHEQDKNIIFLLDWRFRHFINDLNIDKYTSIYMKDQ